MFFEAAKVLKKAFEKTANPELLETLEALYQQSGAEEQILEIIGGIHKSRQKAVPASLLYAKLLYQNNKLEEASKVLGQVNIPSITNKDNKTYFENKGNGGHIERKMEKIESLHSIFNCNPPRTFRRRIE